MARYASVWLEIAREYYDSLAAETRMQVDARLEQLLDNPRLQPDTHFDARTDQWTTTYGDGAGLLVYAVVPERQRLIILRLV
jgi:hypothetical protein